IKIYIERVSGLLTETPLQKLANTKADHTFSIREHMYYGYHLRGRYKSRILDLLEIFGRLDAWHSMAMAVKKYELSFPEFITQSSPHIDAKGLYHILLPQPTPYDLQMNPKHNFLFLTGANMAGKSTLIKSVGA